MKRMKTLSLLCLTSFVILTMGFSGVVANAGPPAKTVGAVVTPKAFAVPRIRVESPSYRARTINTVPSFGTPRLSVHASTSSTVTRPVSWNRPGFSSGSSFGRGNGKPLPTISPAKKPDLNSKKIQGKSRSLGEQAAALIEKNGGKHRVTLRSPGRKVEVDLAGKPHGPVPTPHSKVSPRNNTAPKQPAYNTGKRNAFVRPSTQQDLRVVARFLDRKKGGH